MNCVKALSLLLAVATTTAAEPTCEESITAGASVGDGSNDAWTVGEGVDNGEFTLLKFAGVEVGIRAMQRYVGLLTPTDTNNDSIGEYRVETGPSDLIRTPSTAPPGSWWSFESHVHVSAAEDATKQTVGGYSPLLLSVECVAGQCDTFGNSELASNGVYENLNLNLLGADPTSPVYQSSQNPKFTFWPWSTGILAKSIGGTWPPEDIPGDDTYDQDAEATYKLCLKFDTFCPVCMLVQAALASSAPSGVPSQAPSSSGVPSSSGKPSWVSCCRAI